MVEKPKRINPGLLMGMIGVRIVLILLIVLALNYFNIISLQDIFYGSSQSNQSAKQNEEGDPTRIIAKVGAENIYQKDLDTEVYSYPLPKNEDVKKLLLQKIAKDSIILQALQVEGLIKLDESVFNSLQKDYVKRTAVIAAARKVIENKQDSISGSVISVWFYNTEAGAVGYEKGKEIALSKITAIHSDVKSKKITIQQAAQEIINDKSLAQVDVAYEANAIINFSAGPKESITLDPVFDNLIRQLAPAQITDIYLAKDRVIGSDKIIDAVYMFAQLDQRNVSGNTMDFDKWYTQKESGYEIIYY